MFWKCRHFVTFFPSSLFLLLFLLSVFGLPIKKVLFSLPAGVREETSFSFFPTGWFAIRWCIFKKVVYSQFSSKEIVKPFSQKGIVWWSKPGARNKIDWNLILFVYWLLPAEQMAGLISLLPGLRLPCCWVESGYPWCHVIFIYRRIEISRAARPISYSFFFFLNWDLFPFWQVPVPTVKRHVQTTTKKISGAYGAVWWPIGPIRTRSEMPTSKILSAKGSRIISEVSSGHFCAVPMTLRPNRNTPNISKPHPPVKRFTHFSFFLRSLVFSKFNDGSDGLLWWL